MVKKSQFAIEYLVIAAFAMFMITLTIYAIYSQVGHQTRGFELAQLAKFGNSIIEATNKISYMGEQSRVTLRLVLPSKVNSVYVENKKDIVFEYQANGDVGVMVFHSNTDLALDFDNFNPGVKNLILESKADYVFVCLKTDEWDCNNFCEVSRGENASNSPGDCCLQDCTGCSEFSEDNSSLFCDSDGVCHPSCYGHNGCVGPCP